MVIFLNFIKDYRENLPLKKFKRDYNSLGNKYLTIFRVYRVKTFDYFFPLIYFTWIWVSNSLVRNICLSNIRKSRFIKWTMLLLLNLKLIIKMIFINIHTHASSFLRIWGWFIDCNIILVICANTLAIIKLIYFVWDINLCSKWSFFRRTHIFRFFLIFIYLRK